MERCMQMDTKQQDTAGMRHRIVDIYEYMPVLIDILQSGKEVNLTVTGSSMAPFLGHLRDTLIISPVTEPFQRGDMVFFQRSSGAYVMHRIHHINKKGELFIVGDAQQDIEGPIQPQQVFGVIKKVIRKGKLIQKGDPLRNFFEKVWIRIVPLRPLCVHAATLLWKIRGKG